MHGPEAYPAGPGSRSLRAALIPLTFFGVAALLAAHPWTFKPPYAQAGPFPGWAAEPTTAYHPNLRPIAHFANRTYPCSACHSKFRSDTTTRPALYIHRRIVLQHGMNNRCLNCHHPTNRDALVDDFGREIPYDQPQLVCGKCHGEVYRDWLNGAHGRTNGYWDPRAGPRERRVCDECHDPHHPKFPPQHPAPPPHTLRMGEQQYVMPESEVRDPLRVFRPTSEPPTATASAPTSQPSETELDDFLEELP